VRGRRSRELLERVDADTEVVGIDEGQFFDLELPMICNTLADQGKRVIVAGLDQDYLGKPFEPMPQLLAIAEYITKTHAICMVCGNPANHTQRSSPAATACSSARRALRGALPRVLRSAAGWPLGGLESKRNSKSQAARRGQTPKPD
jgi:thymidine kinase